MPHVDILDEKERMGRPLLVSVGLHTGVAACLLLGTVVGRGNVEIWGEPAAFGGSVAVKTTATIPLPRRDAPANPVADDTESQVPPPPAKVKETQRERTPSKNAVEIPDRRSPERSERSSSRKRYQPREVAENQLTSTAGQRLASEMYGKQGSGQVGVGVDAPLGNRFGAYATLLQRIIGSKWSTADVDSRVHTAPPVKVLFTILRDGTVKDIRLSESSGNRVLDMSAVRAVYDAGQLPGLPPAYEKDQVRIEFWFELKR